jgi:non-ribosomal peptide synthase protein (TIGR01720 family)
MASGKLNRRALPSPNVQKKQEYVAPATDTEIALAQIWEQILKVKQVGAADNFFNLGGDSILAMQVIARAAQVGIRRTVSDFFERQTLRELAVDKTQAGPLVIAQGTVVGEIPLTPIQRWFFESDSQDLYHFNQSIILKSSRRLSAQRLHEAMIHLLRHHDALRLRFRRAAEGWQQWNEPETSLRRPELIQHIDLSALETGKQSEAMTAHIQRLQAGLDIESGLLVRGALFELGGDGQRLLITIHHLAVDIVSWGILVEDLRSVYEQLEQGREVRLPAKTSSLKDWAEHLIAYSSSQDAEGETAYWSGLPLQKCGPLPIDYAGGINDVASIRTVSVALNEEDTLTLLRCAREERTISINGLLLAALSDTIAKWKGSPLIAINIERHGREELFKDLDLSRTVGWFTALFPAVFDLTGISNIHEAANEVEKVVRNIPGGGAGYGILRYLNAKVDLTNHLQPEISFNYLGQSEGRESTALLQSTGESVPGTQSPRTKRRHVIDISGGIFNGCLKIHWLYSANLHQHSTVQALASDFTERLQRLIETQKVSSASNPGMGRSSVMRDGNGNSVEAVPLTPIQLQCMQSMGPEFLRNIVVMPLSCPSDVSAPMLEKALHHLIQQHDALRLQLHFTQSGWQQSDAGVVVSEGKTLLKRVDLGHIDSKEEQDTLIMEHWKRLISSIDLGSAPLLRAALIQLGKSRPPRLLLGVHHFAHDLVSARILREDLETAYLQLIQGQPVSLPTKTTPFKIWAQHLQEYSEKGIFEEAGYWQALPWQRCVSLLPEVKSTQPPTVGRITVSLAKEESQALLKTTQRVLRMPFEDMLLAALSGALIRWTGKRIFAIDRMHHGRTHMWDDIDVSRTVGWFSTTVPFVMDLSAVADGHSILKAVGEQLRAIPNHGIGYGILKYMARRLSSGFSSEVGLNYLGRIGKSVSNPLFPRAKYEEQATLYIAPQLEHGHLIELMMFVENDELFMNLMYRSDLWPEARIRELGQHVFEYIKTLLAAPPPATTDKASRAAL